MVNIENISKSFGSQILFRQASFLIGENEKIGVIGPNGAGKSTFFKILMSEEQPDEGEVRSAKTVRQALLRQEWVPHDDDTVLTATLRGHATWFEAMRALSELEPLHPGYQTAENVFSAEGGYTVEPQAKAILSGLGFSEETFHAPCKLLSGGWRMRVQLAGLLLAEPELLLLDEPTNHLDVESVLWFENFLLNYSKTFMIISHDRRLIERLSTSILDFTPPKITLWPVSFRQYEQDKAMRMNQLEAEIENKEREIEKLEDFVNRFRAKASKARQAQSKLKSSERVHDEIEKLKEDMPLVSKRPSKFRIGTSQRTPKTAFTFEHATFGYEHVNPLFSLEYCAIEGGKKIGVIGVNGVGKSTFLKTCAGELALLKGSLKRNEALNIGYFAQHRLEDLPLGHNAYDYLEQDAKGLSISEIRGIAASLGLTAWDLDKMIRAMSGGEKARLSLAKILLNRPDVLLLDEPTNHLDIEACDAMIQGLRDYEGSVLVVSHNRDFLDRLVHQILEIQPEAAFVHFGNYSEWMNRKQGEVARAVPSNSSEQVKSGKKTKEQKRQEAEERQKKHALLKNINKDIAGMESEVEFLKKEMNELDDFLAKPESPKESDFAQKLKRRGKLTSEIEDLEKKYLHLLEVREELEDGV